jgi:tetratricopeptide (TPR) repeat protein
MEEGDALLATVKVANEVKREGNAALAAGDLDVALEYYDAALRVIAPYCRTTVCGGRETEEALLEVSVALKNNVALVLLKMAESIEAEVGGDAALDVYGDAIAAADAVLVLAPGNEKAVMRKLRATERVRRLDRAGHGGEGR